MGRGEALSVPLDPPYLPVYPSPTCGSVGHYPSLRYGFWPSGSFWTQRFQALPLLATWANDQPAQGYYSHLLADCHAASC